MGNWLHVFLVCQSVSVRFASPNSMTDCRSLAYVRVHLNAGLSVLRSIRLWGALQCDLAGADR